jgi:hypothetical protein
MSTMKCGIKPARLTTGVSSATVPIKSQITPLSICMQINHINSMTISKNCHHPTCFQSKRPSPNLPPPPRRRRSNPTSMVESKIMSVARMAITVIWLLSTFRITQMLCSTSHRARICELISPEVPKCLKIGYSPARSLITSHVGLL